MIINIMKFIIYGSQGWIGNKVVSYLSSQNIDFICGVSRVNDQINLENEILNSQATHIISLIGRTHGIFEDQVIQTIDYLEKPGKLVENVRDNLYSPILLAILAQKHNLHFTYLGTGCIFDYDNNHPLECNQNELLHGFTEESKPNFFGSSYSIVKGFTDQLMSMYADHTLNLRIRMPITDEVNPRNFITKITKYSRICSIHNSMTVLDELIPYMIDMSIKKITGTVNLTNPGRISHNEILTLYRDIVDPTFTWQNFTIEEQDQILASKRSNNYLETERLQELYPDVMDIHQSVRMTLIRMRNKMNDNNNCV